ncbi:nitrilase-related carbon-nitrogen hydrolase [Terrilactibacillus sp. S3-3]|nr:nitrilase-related carbon-nitrogen hydrolase [Terrilactibacillus sp. S3-3]
MSSMNFIRVSAACPVTKVADVDFNVANIKLCIDKAVAEKAKLVVFPELSVTSYTCADLFLQKQLLDKSEEGIRDLAAYSKNKDVLIAVGAPLRGSTIVFSIVPTSFLTVRYSGLFRKASFRIMKSFMNAAGLHRD